jgi:hypothetical protein
MAGTLSVGPQGFYYAERRYHATPLHVMNVETDETHLADLFLIENFR